MNNEQANLGGGGLRPVAFNNGNLQSTGRPADDNGLAEVENNGEINEESETQRVDIPSGVAGRTLASSDTDTEPDSRRKAAGGNSDAGAVNSSPVPATSTGDDEPFLLATGTDGNVVLPFRKRLPVQEPVLATSTGSVENKRVIIRPSDCPIWWEKLPEAAQEYWHLYEWRGKYEHTKHQSGRIRVFVLYGPKWDKNTKELIRASTGEFITGRVRPYDAFIPEETYQLLKDEGYEKK